MGMGGCAWELKFPCVGMEISVGMRLLWGVASGILIGMGMGVLTWKWDCDIVCV